jgi:hypothetical protein
LNEIARELSLDYLQTDESEFGMTQSAQRRIVINSNTTSTKQNYEIALEGDPFIFLPWAVSEMIAFHVASVDDRQWRRLSVDDQTRRRRRTFSKPYSRESGAIFTF